MVAACEAELRTIAERQTALKALLYGKFVRRAVYARSPVS